MNSQSRENEIKEGDMFKQFVDNRVRETTKYQSAEELMKKSKPWLFVFACFGVFAIIGLILGGPVAMLVLGAFFGYAATFVVSGIIRSGYRGKYKGRYAGEIDVEKLIVFLSEYLPKVSPAFHEWGYLTKKGGIITIFENAVVNAVGEIHICSEFGENRKTLVAFYIRSRKTDDDSVETLYFVDALKKGFMIDGRAAGFLGHGTLIKTAPILHAAMEYYLNQYGGEER